MKRSFPFVIAIAAMQLLYATARSAALADEQPFLEKIDLFTAGQGGYARYHIPGDRLTIARFNLPWLTDGQDRLPQN